MKNIDKSSEMSPSAKRRVGIVGYGSLGRHLASCVLGDPSLELWHVTQYFRLK